MTGVDTCERCGFDRGDWNEQDATRTLQEAEALLAGWSEDAPPPLDAKLRARQVDDLAAIAAFDDLYDRVHHLWHGLVSIADVRRAGGDAAAHQVGSVSQLNASGGGVPKSAIDTATVGIRGVDGDVQAHRVHHGRPWQALCLWSQEIIDDLATDGHPISAGSAGENITIAGLDWPSLRGGTIMSIGNGDDAVRIQLSAPATPCKQNAKFFDDGDFMRMDHDRHPGMSRWYASVLTTGTIRPGDPVVVSPA